MISWILIKKATGLYMGWSKSVTKPECGQPDDFEWIDWRINTGTEDDPIYTGKAVPSDDGECYYDVDNNCLTDADGNVWEEETEE